MRGLIEKLMRKLQDETDTGVLPEANAKTNGTVHGKHWKTHARAHGELMERLLRKLTATSWKHVEMLTGRAHAQLMGRVMETSLKAHGHFLGQLTEFMGKLMGNIIEESWRIHGKARGQNRGKAHGQAHRN